MQILSSGGRATRRRLLLGFMGVLGTAALVAGCSANSGSSTTTASSSYTAPDKNLSANITYALWDQTQKKAIDANIVEFNKAYPKIKVNVDVTPWTDYWTKLQTEASSNTLPDLFWLNGPNFQLYASNGKVEPITSVVKAGAIDPANYPKALDALYTLNGVEYGVPKDFDTIGLWYNKDLFQKAGVSVPTSSWTWADFNTAASTISQKLSKDGIYGAVAGMDGQTTYYNTIFQAGGSVLASDGKKSGYDSAATQKGIQFWTDLIASKGSPTMQQLTDTAADQWFVSGKAAMYWGGDWARSEIAASPIASSVNVAPLPAGEKKATVIHGVSNVVAAAGKHKQAAQALQVFLASKKAQQQQGDMGAIIPAFNGTQAAFAKSLPGVDLQVFLDELVYAQPLPTSKNTAAWNAFEAALLPDAFSGSKPVAATLKDLATQMNGALAKE
ncbi:ABC transporter substrate-binding protein [Lacisediminihabitans profunda]|uniref:Sugar ABC transporter substrate-binding protein n=1 Tax=Lacisediminihabitans profunda TaxID=2594790 RepID=A0A5C8UXS9_9MICO|nr:sugar ABC transporter substrate-binding protein [Lacisediminihabitans profunda]TXN32492.1 sugar ABC transporter substrate-binding protein [Lacisediminihabitans profunda]